MTGPYRWAGIALGLMLVATAGAVEESRLWLPASLKEQLQQPLADAAAMAENETRCEQVLEGRLASRRHEGLPLLTIICRDRATGRSYYRNYAVSDSGELTFVASNLPKAPVDYVPPLITLEEATAAPDETSAIQPEPEPAAAPTEPAASPAPQPPTPAQIAWDLCYGAMLERTGRMRDMVVLDEPRPEAEASDDGGWVYRIPFRARDSLNQQLHYVGVCRVDADGDVELAVSVGAGD